MADLPTHILVVATKTTMVETRGVEQDMGAAQLSLGANHLVALMRDGSVKAWGDNTYGQLNVEGWER